MIYEITAKENFYTVQNAKIFFYFDEEINGYILCGGQGTLTEFVIPDKINGIDVKGAEGDISIGGFDRIRISSENPYFEVIDGVLFNSGRTELICYPPEKENEIYIIPSGVKIIGDGAFGCAKLKAAALPRGTEVIYQYAFALCRKLERIYLPSCLKKVCLKAFISCDSLRNVYYEGTEEEWNKIDLTLMNDALVNAHICFNYNINSLT